MSYYSKLAFELIWIAVVMAVLGSLVSRTFMLFTTKKERVVSLSFWKIPWNDNYQLELCFAVTGVLLHSLCEVLGVNRWYIVHSAATWALQNSAI